MNLPSDHYATARVVVVPMHVAKLHHAVAVRPHTYMVTLGIEREQVLVAGSVIPKGRLDAS